MGREKSRRYEVGDRGVLRENWAARGGGRSVAVLCGHAKRAVMRAVATAACGQIAVRVLCLCEQRRDGRKTEGCKQQDGEKAAHLRFSVTDSRVELVNGVSPKHAQGSDSL